MKLVHCSPLSPILLLTLPFAGAKQKISLQWAICDSDPQETLVKLGLSSTTPPYKENPITYYDEQPPVHIHSGIMFRTKTNKGRPLSTIKVRFDKETSNVPGFVTCGWDRYGYNSPAYSCEKRCPLDPAAPEEIWHREQVEFAERYQDINWTALTAYGPYPNAKWKVRINGHKAKFDDVVAEGLHLMEIETKVPEAKAHDFLEATMRYLRDRGVALCRLQEGKTMRLFRAMGLAGEDEL
ncbi:uncharacterized protein MAM_07380 [Metarhizium album ARSEF 1941]|uniref:Uncharacterized protein n=1 Tax=Metarhizium album (strain ARSEF 1941) TaxID=1081103 RepID=A0A0B2WMA9_METAS|nr:uncharacterized protein MAM_07380 [Metarhizium album ARSEF 1941]KHN94784.1 hypothetical protein MAM_07380 [Metarhizium album ARSEF 1941]